MRVSGRDLNSDMEEEEEDEEEPGESRPGNEDIEEEKVSY